MATDPPESRVDLSGRRVHLLDAGHGPAVLLVHGLPSRALLWREVVPVLARRARVLAPDLPGFGRSDPSGDEPLDLPAHAARLLRLLDALGIERATVVGHDVGGGIAQVLATRHPERVERLGLVNSVAYDNWPVPEMKALRLASPLMDRVPARLTRGAIERGLRRGFLHPERANRYLEHFLEPFSTAEGMEVLLRQLRALDDRSTLETAPLLRGLRIPAAVVWGRHDPFLDPEWAERLASDLPAAELTRVEASHFSPADAPHEVARALLALLDR